MPHGADGLPVHGGCAAPCRVSVTCEWPRVFLRGVQLQRQVYRTLWWGGHKALVAVGGDRGWRAAVGTHGVPSSAVSRVIGSLRRLGVAAAFFPVLWTPMAGWLTMYYLPALTEAV